MQLFGSALQLSPHLHVLLPEGMWSDDGALLVLPPPDDAEVEKVLHRLLGRLRGPLAEVEGLWPDDDEEGLWAAGAQQRLALEDEVVPKKKARRLAVALGFSLHADTAVHAFDRVGLRRLCGYGARGPVAEERLSRLPDGRYQWQPKRGAAVTLTADAFLQRLLALVPPKGFHLTCFHGAFAPNAKLRPLVMLQPPQAPRPAHCASSSADGAQEKPKRPRLDWATALQRTFGVDVWSCPCGGRRRVRALVTQRDTAAAILRSMGLSDAPRPLSQAPPQLSFSLG